MTIILRYQQPRHVILSHGLGLHSSVLLKRWIEDPSSRDFDLADLIVISSQLGRESAESKRQMEQLVYPDCRAAGIRVVQVARRGPSTRDGLQILDDTTAPRVCHTAGGAYTIYDEMLTAGTIPQYAGGVHICALKWKAWVGDSLIKHLIGDVPYRHALGYHHGEQRRIEKDRKIAAAQPNRTGFFPLDDWRWMHVDCVDYSLATYGEIIARSACDICPFGDTNGGRAAVLDRFSQSPWEGAQILFLERVALALNENAQLYKRTSAHTLLSENNGAWTLYQDMLRSQHWGLFRVQRILPEKGQAARRVQRLGTFADEAAARRALRAAANSQGLRLDMRDPLTPRLRILERGTKPTIEEQIVIAPAVVADKAHASFKARWQHEIARLAAPIM